MHSKKVLKNKPSLLGYLYEKPLRKSLHASPTAEAHKDTLDFAK